MEIPANPSTVIRPQAAALPLSASRPRPRSPLAFFLASLLLAYSVTGCAPLSSPPAPAADAPLDGFGKDIPLATAVRQIVPPELDVSSAPGIDETVPVDWTGGPSWHSALDNLLDRHGLAARYASGRVTVVAKEPTIAFSIKPGDTLRGAVDQWLDRCPAYSVVWPAKPIDWRVDAPGTLSGTCEEALATLLAGFSEASPHPEAEITANAAVRISAVDGVRTSSVTAVRTSAVQ